MNRPSAADGMDRDTAILDETQERLAEHFRAIARTRENSGFPVFALEHGLTQPERMAVFPLLRVRVKSRLPLTRHWLLWAVYAAEVGYDYTGDEYWQSFEDRTPGWGFNDRNKLRTWFRKFQYTYRGVLPTGPWAEHFSIISWPITHAILPLYLQRQFAKALYDLRFRLASRSTRDTRTIGRLLGVYGPDASTRFQAFVQQEELTGQIVLALLGAKPSEGEELIHSPTLQRIVDDLERVRGTREWMKETRRVVADRFTGIGRGLGPTLGPGRGVPPDISHPDYSHLTIRPNLLLRHVGAGKWAVVLEVKSFRAVAALRADLQSFLRRTRCRLNGAGDMKPAGWLLSGNRKGTLQSWPDERHPLIVFERSHPDVIHLLELECRLTPGPVWLFRIASDGTAREISDRVVRPGREYIVLRKGVFPQLPDGASPCDIDCAGVTSFRVAIPQQVTAAMTAQLSKLELQVARTIHVWPAGLPGRGWDGEGRSEWLTTEFPCFGIAYDHPVDGFDFHLDDGSQAFIPSESSAGPVFVRLPVLAAGMHTLTVKARRSAELDTVAQTPPAKGFAQLAVRDPEPWIPGVLSYSGLVVTIDPDAPTLDTFWRNKVRLFVNGPEAHRASFAVRLKAADGSTVLSEQVGTLDLPVTPETWCARFGDFLRKDAHTWKYLEAASCTLTIREETLGNCLLRFEHDPLPVRWLVRSRQRDIVVRLVDDSGQDEDHPEIHFYSMERPLESRPLALEAVRSDSAVTPPGGLHWAKLGRHTDAVVVSTPSSAEGLQGLRIDPVFPQLPRNALILSKSFRLLRDWHDARWSGFLVDMRHRRTVTGFLDALFASLCGKNWANAEAAFRQTRTTDSTRSLAMLADRRTDFGSALLTLSDATPTDAALNQQFSEAAARHGVCRDRRLCDFALRLANQPVTTVRDPGFDELLAKIVDNPAILRGARFLALLAENNSGDTTATFRLAGQS